MENQLGVGAGNTPAIIDETADVTLAVNSIIHSKTFDNGMICASEQSIIIHKNVYEQAKAEFAKRGCYFLNPEETEKVRKTIIINGALNSKSTYNSRTIRNSSARVHKNINRRSTKRRIK